MKLFHKNLLMEGINQSQHKEFQSDKKEQLVYFVRQSVIWGIIFLITVFIVRFSSAAL